MSRSTLPTSGKSYKITWTVDGTPVAVADKVERFEIKCEKTRMKSKYIGESGSQISEEFDGWSGSFTAVIDGPEFDEVDDAITASIQANTTIDLGLNITATYADGRSKAYTYPNVKMDMSVSGARGETVKAAYTWESGANRIPLT